MNIDIDQEIAGRPLSRREKIAVYVLLTLFHFILPAKFSHQVDKVCDEIKRLME
jgi:hypothetical protein